MKKFLSFGKKQKTNTSYIINDPNGMLLSSFGTHLEHLGYTIKILNFLNPLYSCTYNPFYYFKKDEDIFNTVDIILYDTKSLILQEYKELEQRIKQAERDLLASLIFYLYYEAPPDEENFTMIIELLHAAKTKSNNIKSDLDRLFDMLEEKNPHHIALSLYNNYKSPSEERFLELIKDKSPLESLALLKRLFPSDFSNELVVDSLLSRLSLFNEREIAAITIAYNTNSISLENLTKTKMVLFITYPEDFQDLSFILSILYSQIASILDDIDTDKSEPLVNFVIEDEDFFTVTNMTNKATNPFVNLIQKSEFQRFFKKRNKKIPYDIKKIRKTPFEMLDYFFSEFKDHAQSVGSIKKDHLFDKLTTSLCITVDCQFGLEISTLCHKMAKRFGLIFVNAMELYIGLCLHFKQNGVNISQANSYPKASYEIADGKVYFYINNTLIVYTSSAKSEYLYSELILSLMENTFLRSHIIDTLKNIADSNHIIIRGFNTGTDIFPNAPVKFFVSAEQTLADFADMLEKSIEEYLKGEEK